MSGVHTLRFDDKKEGRITLVKGMKRTPRSQDRMDIRDGLNVFETMRSYTSREGCVVACLCEHLERLALSAKLMTIPIPDFRDIESEINEVAVGDRSIRVTLNLTGGRTVESYPFDFSRVGAPVSVGVFEVADTPMYPSNAKHGARSEWSRSAVEQGVDEVLLISSQGEILEANNSNVFLVIDDRVVTPPLDGRLLAGITRHRVIRLATELGFKVSFRPIRLSDDFDEMFLTSSLKQVAPVSSICGRPLMGRSVATKLNQSLSALFC